MKVLKRIIVILILLFTAFIVCYFVRTCQRVKGDAIEYENLKNSAYKSINDDILVISDENIWYITEENTYFCTFESYEDNKLIISSDKHSFEFRVISSDTVYDLQTKEFLYRGGGK